MKTVDFSETVAASDLKVSGSRHLIEYMKICEYIRSRPFLDLRSRPFLDLDPIARSCTYKISNWIFSETTVSV